MSIATGGQSQAGFCGHGASFLAAEEKGFQPRASRDRSGGVGQEVGFADARGEDDASPGGRWRGQSCGEVDRHRASRQAPTRAGRRR